MSALPDEVELTNARWNDFDSNDDNVAVTSLLTIKLETLARVVVDNITMNSNSINFEFILNVDSTRKTVG